MPFPRNPIFPPTRQTRVGNTLVALSVALLAAQPSDARAQGITYTIAPTGASLQWDRDLGLRNHSLYGAQASLDFERLISLQGYYLTNDGVKSAVDRLGLSGDLATQLKDQQLNVRSFGANVVWKFWKGGVAPFLKTGGGILEIRPDSGRSNRQIVLNAGGGIRIGADAPVHLDLYAEDMMMRIDRYSLFNSGTPVARDPNANKLRHNYVFGAALGIPLGLNTNDRTREEGERVQWGLAGASLTLEPFAGRMSFDKKLGADSGRALLRNQELAGLRAGIDLGRYVGVRGFYWRGTDRNFKRVESLQSWGGELQFRLNSSPGLTPYLLAGAAQLDFDAEDTTATAQISDDKLSLLLGAGVSLPIGERFALNASARDYLFGQGNGADSVSSPSDLRHNWMFSVGLRVSLAGRSGTRAAQQTSQKEQSLGARVRADSLRLVALRDSLQRRDVASGQSLRDSLMIIDGRVVRVDSTTLERLKKEAKADSTKRGNMNVPGFITIPVPVVGEFYVRYGPAQGMTTSFPSLQGDSTRLASMSTTEREAYLNRVIDSVVTARVAARTATLERQLQQTQARQAEQPTVVTAPAAAPVVVERVNRYDIIGSDARGGLMVYTGATVNGGAQLLIGGRFDLGSFSGINSNLHFAPEIAFGAGSGGRSTMVVANAQYMFRKMRLGQTRTIQPHALAGVGFLNFSDRVGSRDGLQGVINLGYGASIPLMKNPGTRAAPVLTFEHQGVDFFQLNRFLVGLSWRM